MPRAAVMRMKGPSSSTRRTRGEEPNEKRRSPQRWASSPPSSRSLSSGLNIRFILRWHCRSEPFLQASPKRPKDTEAEGDPKVDRSKSNANANAEAKLNDVAEPKATAPSSQSESKAEAQEKAPAGGQLKADKVRHWQHRHSWWNQIQVHAGFRLPTW